MEQPTKKTIPEQLAELDELINPERLQEMFESMNKSIDRTILTLREILEWNENQKHRLSMDEVSAIETEVPALESV